MGHKAHDTPDDAQIERQASAMYAGVAKKFGLPNWDHASQELQDIWRQCARDMNEIGQGISDDD